MCCVLCPFLHHFTDSLLLSNNSCLYYLFRYWNKDLWANFFSTLLNVPSCSALPNLSALRKKIIDAFYGAGMQKDIHFKFHTLKQMEVAQKWFIISLTDTHMLFFISANCRLSSCMYRNKMEPYLNDWAIPSAVTVWIVSNVLFRVNIIYRKNLHWCSKS